MAKAKANKIKVIEVRLELCEQEASVLVEILHKIGGPPSGPRGAADSIRQALQDAGVERYDGGTGWIAEGTIKFP